MYGSLLTVIFQVITEGAPGARGDPRIGTCIQILAKRLLQGRDGERRQSALVLEGPLGRRLKHLLLHGTACTAERSVNAETCRGLPGGRCIRSVVSHLSETVRGVKTPEPTQQYKKEDKDRAATAVKPPGTTVYTHTEHEKRDTPEKKHPYPNKSAVCLSIYPKPTLLAR